MAERKQKPKKLNKASINKLEKEKFPIKKIIIDVDGEEYEVGIHEKFRATQIENVVKDMIWIQEECEKSGIEANVFTASLLALMKNFTDINFSKNDILQDINMFINMSNLGILDQIMSAFDPQEIEKLNKSITDMNKNIPKATKMMEDLMHEQVDLQLEN